MKSRTFTIFLLTEGVTLEKALVNADALELVSEATAIPSGSVLYLTKNEVRDPWWKGYLGLTRKLQQSYPGGVLFIPVGKRWFAATFCQSYHHLSASSYEYDFGIRTTLNAVDRNSLRSTDAVNPETAKRERIQAPRESDFSFFSFDGDSNVVLKRISGKVQEQYQDLFTNVTGCDSIRITTKKTASELVQFCQNLLGLYKKTEAEKNFPEVFNIRPEKNQEILDKLDEVLLMAIKQKDDSLVLSYPDMVDYQNIAQIKFGSLPSADLFTMESFWELLPESKLKSLTIAHIKNYYNVVVLNQDGNSLKKTSPSLYKCLIFECHHDGRLYHFCEGKWYSVNENFLGNLRASLNKYFCLETMLPANICSSEAEYNKKVIELHDKTVLFDREDYYPKGHTPIELCDLCQLGDDNSVSLIHVKVGVHSCRLSHLFSQGYVGSRELLSDSGAFAHFKKIIDSSALKQEDKDKIISKVKDRKNLKVVYAIITKKAKELKSDALPLFGCNFISLIRFLL